MNTVKNSFPPRTTMFYYWAFILIILVAGSEIYRFIQYVQNWQILLDYTAPINVWVMTNISFTLFVAVFPVIAGLVLRTEWAPSWSIRYLLILSLITLARTMIFSIDPLAPIHWLSIGAQVFFSIALAAVLFFMDPRKVVYADNE